jgi:hypothetical protein
MKLTCTAWVVSLNTCDDGPGKTYRSFQKHEPLLLPDVISFYWLLCIRCFVCNSLKAHLCTALTTQNTTTNNCIILHAQNTTALKPNVFLTGIASVIGHKQRTVPCQGQLQTPQSVTIIVQEEYFSMELIITYTQ